MTVSVSSVDSTYQDISRIFQDAVLKVSQGVLLELYEKRNKMEASMTSYRILRPLPPFLPILNAADLNADTFAALPPTMDIPAVTRFFLELREIGLGNGDFLTARQKRTRWWVQDWLLRAALTRDYTLIASICSHTHGFVVNVRRPRTWEINMTANQLRITWKDENELNSIFEKVTTITLKHGTGDMPLFWCDLCCQYLREEDSPENPTKVELAQRLGITPEAFYKRLERFRLFLQPHLQRHFDASDDDDYNLEPRYMQ